MQEKICNSIEAVIKILIDFPRVLLYTINKSRIRNGNLSKPTKKEPPPMYDIVLFDLDGTLIDSEVGITNCATYALGKFGIRIEDPLTLRPFIGPPLFDSFSKLYGFSDEDALKAVDYYRERFGEKGVYEFNLYTGVEELLAKLKSAGKTLILATSKYEFYAKKIIEHLGFTKYFTFAVGSCKDGSRAAKAEVIAYALREQGITELSRVVMVGDRKHDIEGARAVGIDSIGVLYGFGDREELEKHGATHIAENTDQIFEIITKV